MREEIEQLLNSAPAPSPWYLRIPESKLQTKFGTASWKELAPNAGNMGGMVLQTAQGDNLAIAKMYTWVGRAPNNLLLAYSQKTVRQEKKLVVSPTPPVELRLYDPSGFMPFESITSPCREMKDKNIPFYTNGGLLASCEIPSHVACEAHVFNFPEKLRELGEILILCHSGVVPDGPNQALMIVNPSESRYEIFPQDWFNKGDTDFGYQWITRVIRHPKTGRIYGDGIRIGVFLLDASLRNVETWL